MDILQIVGLGLIAVFLILTVKTQSSTAAMLISLLTGVFLFAFMVPPIRLVFEEIQRLALQANVDLKLLGTILKIIAIAYIAEFGAQLVRDSGESGLASKIEFAGKILILVLAIPIVRVVVDTIMQVMIRGGAG
ncbi:stage III sporulation protein AD [Effusibacillus lacus]|uniref:Stage III sporulation protein AD n=1 Tax=Effusibacillus lacus TaxID=1348429 RepID=A0A292YR71_9BACL|nr:stage III sporulation protein AD [Effusibacillus lacus]TCS72533.1 stage III sporulation protein AD [Effusibacillus lacus]GAX90904.1 stage III sporulation protein AD [Effusibacillus lacus]